MDSRGLSYEQFPQEGRRLGLAEQLGESDPTEKLFIELARKQGLIVNEGEMIKLPGKKQYKGDKRSTTPDFIIREKEGDEGIFVEVTAKNERCGHKGAQLKVMREAGLAARYVRLTRQDLESLGDNGSLLELIKSKISAHDSQI
jgi:hypothetical protein